MDAQIYRCAVSCTPRHATRHATLHATPRHATPQHCTALHSARGLLSVLLIGSQTVENLLQHDGSCAAVTLDLARPPPSLLNALLRDEP